MTAIAGLVHDGLVILGGDSAGSAGWHLRIRADRKVFTNGPYVFGFTSSFRMGQLLRYALTPPEPDYDDLPRFMVTTFVDAVRTCLKDGGHARKESERENGGTFLVGVGGRLFEVEDDYQVAEHEDGYAAIGCGAATVLGALHATAPLGMAADERLLRALEAAERFSNGVRGPFHSVVGGARPDPPAPAVAAPKIVVNVEPTPWTEDGRWIGWNPGQQVRAAPLRQAE
ncbi:hypothetical protein ACFWYW_46985 [Nonomuraea sp. NPDC059023]|uniref:hypothetical protein n=1 Tax=unclassified Nonomuraea TaxID=2593643 RepID=UPI0036A64283